MLALHNDTEIYSYPSQNGWVYLPNGNKVSPAVAGWEGQGYKISEVAEVAAPEIDPIIQILSSHVELIAGVPTQVWSVSALPVVNASEVTKLQLRAELIARGLWSDFKTYLAANPDAEDEFMLASSLSVSHPTVAVVAAAFGVDAQELFNAAGNR